MNDFFREGGIGMYPTALFGLASLLLAVVYAARPQPRLLPLVIGTGAAALLAGALGMLRGLQTTFSAIIDAKPPIEQPQLPIIAFAGFYESANNLVLALALCVAIALAVGVGGARLKPVTA